MVSKRKETKKEGKAKKFEAIYDILGQYTKALLVQINNISADQIHQTRRELRAVGSLMLMGKNTLIKKVIESRIREPMEGDRRVDEKKSTWFNVDYWATLKDELNGNVAIIFTNGDFSTIKSIYEQHQREAPARAGQIAQCDVFIKPGSTGLDPKQTAFFQQLNIPTKIVKSMIEIVSETKVVGKGDIVEPSHQVLLEKLHIKPFSYKLQAVSVIDHGKIFSAKVLDISTKDILARYAGVLNNVAAVGLQIGYPTLVSVRQSIMNSFKNLVAVTFETEVTFPQAEKFKSAASAAPVAAAPVAAPVAAPKVEVVEEVIKPFGFGDDDEY
jgi:large subunit ribosomal protein LP0